MAPIRINRVLELCTKVAMALVVVSTTTPYFCFCTILVQIIDERLYSGAICTCDYIMAEITELLVIKQGPCQS